ncbi:MAG: class I SAM-dependent methyltransferase [Phycisphaerales bacterium]|nr:MAG: class I SAM-dependent methyltransferase [Phycisphaerales bacterium]
MRKELHEANRESWNAATAAHNTHKVDQAGFLHRGGSTLFPEEIGLLGDISGKRLVHLQCNAGQDTLSLAQLGALATGVDISDEAIAFAKKLSAESGIQADFHRADVYDWLDAARDRAEQFDIVFCSYGSICWLSDLDRWAASLAAILTPGGRFVIVDFHPVSMMFNERVELTYPYFFEGKPLKWDEGVGDYVAATGPALAPSGFQQGLVDFKNPHVVYEFQWHIGAILNSLLNAGLKIEQFHEYPYTNAVKFFENMREDKGRRMYPPDNIPSIPMMFGLAATMPELASNRG